jgi:hypothetical protein
MKLLGRDISGEALLARIEERLRSRGLQDAAPLREGMGRASTRVDPLTFNLAALEEHADAARPLPTESTGTLAATARWVFRKSCQLLIDEAFGRQRVFNGHVRDSYAQLSAEVMRLRSQVEALSAPPGKKKPSKDKPK